MKTLLLFTGSLLLSVTIMAQREETLFGSLDLSGAWGAFTYNYSNYEDDWALVRGGYGGLEFSENIFLGYGGWRVRDDVTINDRNLEFRYGGLMLGVAPGAYKSVHPRLTVLFGPGKLEYRGEDDRVLVFQPSGGLELNLFQWWRLGVEGGYRFVLDNEFDDLSTGDVSSPFIQIDLRFGFSWGD